MRKSGKKNGATSTLCPACHRVVKGRLKPEAGDVYLEADCPDHGLHKALYFRDAALYDELSSIADWSRACERFKCAEGEPCRDHLSKTYDLLINLTQRCNMRCPVCFADALPGDTLEEPSKDEILRLLPESDGDPRANVCFIGGEPTLHPDLPELIRAVRDRGYIPRLSTNGLRLLDPGYAAALAEAGLRWVVLQFDGLDDRVYEELRGMRLVEKKARIIDACQRNGMIVQLAVMVDAEINADQIRPILDFAFATEAVKWVNFYPLTRVNRTETDGDHTLHLSELLQKIEDQTDRQLTRGDFLAMMRLMGRLERLTGWEVLRQKVSTCPMILFRRGDRIVPLPRLLSARGLLQNAGTLPVVLSNAFRIWNYQEFQMSNDVLFVTVEKFHSLQTLDLTEASCCHMSFLTRSGLVPFDVYNCLYRDNPW